MYYLMYFQQLDDVYHDVSGVMAETLVQSTDVIALKVRKMAARWRSYHQQNIVESMQRHLYEKKSLQFAAKKSLLTYSGAKVLL